MKELIYLSTTPSFSPQPELGRRLDLWPKPPLMRRDPSPAAATSTSTTSTASPSSSSSTTASSRRPVPFRVTSRRRTPSSTSTTSTTEEPTTMVVSDESLQDIDDTAAEAFEEPTNEESTSPNRTKAQPTRRPLLLKEQSQDQNPSATNEEERKRHSKKFSASIKKNQLEEVIKKAKSKEESSREVDATTEGLPKTTIDDYSAETALAIATHQLLSAPLPIHDHEDRKKPSTEYKTSFTETETPYDEFSSTPIYKPSQDYTTFTNILNNTPRTSSSTTYTPKSSTYPSSTYTSAFEKSTFSSPYPAKVSRPAGFSPPEIITLSPGPSTLKTAVETRFSSTFPVPENIPSTSRYLPSQKLIPVPVEDYGFTTGGYSEFREPAYFTREYLLESPVTKTYDDEYQYLSPVTTPQTTTKVPKKIVHKKISTTLRPTVAAYVPPVTSSPPRRKPSRKIEKVPFEKVQKPVKPFYKQPVDEYDYYDEGDEKMGQKYEEGTKVVLHAKGIIECLDIGNFPHPTSCKKFISCARLENGSLLGWEYICPKGLSFDPVGGICNWSAGLGCDEKEA